MKAAVDARLSEQQLKERLEQLERENAELRAQVKELHKQLERYRELYLKMLEQVRKLERGIIAAQKRERFCGDGQLSLQLLGMMLSEQQQPKQQQPVKAHTRRKPTGRKPLPENLPRVDIEVVDEEVTRKGLENFERIGEDVTERVERRPAAWVVLRVHKPKFVPKGSKKAQSVRVLQGRTPELPIEGAVAGPAMLSESVVKRWGDHMPLYRLERMYRREGLDISRSTICGWHEKLSELCRPVVEAMKRDALLSPYLCVDATGVLVQAREKCRNGHFFVVVAPERHVLFNYAPRHDSEAVDELLKDYRGYLVADAHSVYDHLYRSGEVVEVACWAHARRYFFRALETEPELARQGLEYIGTLFSLERQYGTWPPEKKLQLRRERAGPVVEKFFAWCEGVLEQVVDESPMAKAVKYALRQRAALERFLEDGRLPLHNNFSEQQLRREALGRKNWLFVGSDDGGQINATFVTLIASCQLHGVEPFGYLRDLLYPFDKPRGCRDGSWWLFTGA